MYGRERILNVCHPFPYELSTFDHLDLVSLLFGRKHFTRIGASKMRIKNPHVCTAHKGVERIENIFGKRPVLGIHRLGNIGEP
ncbi:Uncharacterised protein [Klebsiella pneumoniae]|nr:Uncharacterised protein [Klebsiella pneumoniae]